MNFSALAIAAIVVGLALMLGGPLAASLTPSQAFWTEADQQAYSKASVDFHDASYGGGHDHSSGHIHAGPADDAARAKLQAAKADFERHSAKLQRAQSSRGWITIACRGAGAIIAALGVAIYLRSRRGPQS